jgi:hypothetical protein
MDVLTPNRIKELIQSRPRTVDPEKLRKAKTTNCVGKTNSINVKINSENAEIERIGKICEACVAESDKPEWDVEHPDFSPRDDCEFLKCSTCARRRAIREGKGVCPLNHFVLDAPKAEPKPAFEVPPGAVAICIGCGDARSCPSVTFCAGCGGQVDLQIVAPSCPKGKW